MQLRILSLLKVLFIGSFFFLASQKCFGQSNESNDKKWKDLLMQYQSGSINDTDYLKQIDILANRSYKDSALKEKLSTYKEIAWSKDSYQPYRSRYYSFLVNNSTFTHKEGASMYYMEKMEDELKKMNPYINSLNEPRFILSIYGRNKIGNNRRMSEFEKVWPFLVSLPQRILNDSVPAITCMNAITILLNGAHLYLDKKDTAKVMNILHVEEAIWNSIQKKRLLNEGRSQQCLYMLYQVKYSAKTLLNEPYEAKKILDTAYAIVSSPDSKIDPIWRRSAERAALLKLIDFFKDQKRYDSAGQYLQVLKGLQVNINETPEDGSEYLLSYGNLKAEEKNYKTAYESILRAYEINDSVISARTVDINNNMYAQAEAEDKSEALQKAEAKEYKRKITIAIISIVSLLAIILLYLQMRKKERALKERIYKLNYASQLQIMELEEKNLLVKKEEQKRLGMDLHDNLAGTIAAIKIKVETELINNPSPEQSERLKTISNLITSIYEKTRNKSHELYHGWENESEVSFSKRIKLITDNSFSSDKYKTTIDVDDELMTEINLSIKIQILYIIQEAVTNIIKHSAANTISILIYEDVSGLVMQITDNGKGFNIKNKKGIGLSSIRERAAAVNGTVEILSDNKGTEIIVTIPVIFENEMHA